MGIQKNDMYEYTYEEICILSKLYPLGMKYNSYSFLFLNLNWEGVTKIHTKI